MSYILKGPDEKPILRDDKEIFVQDYTGTIKSVSIEKRTLTITGTDETRDRDGDIIRVNGWLMDNYIKNPVFLWAHNYSSVPLGATSSLIRRRNPGRLEFKDIRFPTEGLNPFADMILHLFNEKIINASSVGFLPYKWQELEKSENAGEEPPMWKYGREFTKQELLELSGCPVPSNPSALQNAIKGFVKESIQSEILFRCLNGEQMFDLEKTKDDILEELTVKSEIELIDEDRSVQVQVGENLKATEDKEGDIVIEEKEKEEEVKDTVELSGEELKPLPNEHACRLKNPANFDTFRRGKRNHEGKEYSVIYGKKGDGPMEEQSYRYNKDTWTAAEAGKHCKSHEGTFEAAAASILESIVFDCDFMKQFEELEFGKIILIGEYSDEKGIVISEIKEEILDVKSDAPEGEGETKLEFTLSQVDKEWIAQTIKEAVQSKEEIPAAKAPQEPTIETPDDSSEMKEFQMALGRLRKVANEIEEVVQNATH